MLGRVEGRLVREVDEESGLLELNREEERGRDVDAADLKVGVPAVRQLVRPEGEPRGVRLAVEEVYVVLPDEERRVEARVPADRVRAVGRLVTVDGHVYGSGRAERSVGGVTERDDE